MNPSVPQALGLAVSLAALVHGVGSLRTWRGLRRQSDGAQQSLLRRRLGWLGGIYDRSAAGRRVQRRLWAAQLTLGPSGWRCAQLLLALPLATVLLGAGLDLLPSMALSLSSSRTGGAVLLWLLRHRARAALDAAAPTMARALATELAAWASGPTAVTAAAARLAGGEPQARMGRYVLERAAARVLLGAGPAEALCCSLEEAVPGLAPTSPAAMIATVFALYRHDATGTADALDRLATAVDEDAAVRGQARAAVGEVRTSAVAVPAIAAVTGAVMLASDPPALAAALTPPLLPLLAAACAVIVIAVVAVRRMLTV
jgi:hypothetical protein